MATRNEIKVELTGVHLCCQGCVNAADAALRSVEGVNSRCDMENGTITSWPATPLRRRRLSMLSPSLVSTATPTITNWR